MRVDRQVRATERSGDVPRRPAGEIDLGWLLAALVESSDLVLAFDVETTITWCNPTCTHVLGYEPEEVIGRSIAAFIHPDDVERAAEVVGLNAAGAFDEMPITPAVYRVRRADGTWENLELNGSAGPDGGMLIVARVGGDLVLNDRLLEAVTAHAPFEEQVSLVLEMGTWRHPREGYAILYRDEHGERRALRWNLPPELSGEAGVPGPAPWAVAMATGREVSVANLADASGSCDVAGPELIELARAAGFLGCLVAPVADPDHPGGACIVIWTTAKGPTISGHRYAMGNMVRALTLVLQQRAQVRALERAARVDGLTGTITRARFMELLGGLAAEGARRHALLYIDLDGFKAVNDRLGHAAGDRVLSETAARIREAAPAGAAVARLGGDEFAVLCAPDTDARGACDAAQRIIDAVARPIELDHGPTMVGVSVGLAIGHAGEHPESVLDAADGALLSAKASGRGCWTLAPPRPAP